MTYHITADHLVDTASKAVTEELFREFNKALQSFCNEERDRIAIFRTLRYTRIRLYVIAENTMAPENVRHVTHKDVSRNSNRLFGMEIK